MPDSQMLPPEPVWPQAEAPPCPELLSAREDLHNFAYFIGHELREPLRQVLTYAELLNQFHQANLDPKARDMLAETLAGARRMRRQIDNMLAYSRVYKNGRPFQDIKAENPLQRALLNLRQDIKALQIKIMYDDLPTVWADPEQLTLVFQHLVENAMKFQGAAAYVQISAAGAPETGWTFRVDDNGPGIDKADHERVFNLFQRLAGPTDIAAGAGIGLALSRRIIERHGGRIWVESEPGQGAGVCFFLPGPEATAVAPEAAPLS